MKIRNFCFTVIPQLSIESVGRGRKGEGRREKGERRREKGDKDNEIMR